MKCYICDQEATIMDTTRTFGSIPLCIDHDIMPDEQFYKEAAEVADRTYEKYKKI